MLRPIPICKYNPKPPCTCEVVKNVRENVNAENVMKFVKGLNDSFESVRSRVLMMVPLPDITITFNITITHERQQACGNSIPQIMLAQNSEK